MIRQRLHEPGLTTSRFLSLDLAPLLSREERRSVIAVKSPMGKVERLLKLAGERSIKSSTRRHTVTLRLKENRRTTLKHFVAKLKQLRKPFPALDEGALAKAITAVASAWLDDGLPETTVRTYISHLNWLLLCVSDAMIHAGSLVAAWREMNPHATRAGKPDARGKPATAEQIEAALEAACGHDQRAGLQLQLIYHLQASPQDILSMRPQRAMDAGGLVLMLSRGGRYRPSRSVLLSREQTFLMERAIRMAGAYAHDSLLLPGQKLEEARQHMYFVARKVGLHRGGLGITPAALAAANARLYGRLARHGPAPADIR